MTEFFMIFALLSIWFSMFITRVVLFGAVHSIIQRFRVGGVNAIKLCPNIPR